MRALSVAFAFVSSALFDLSLAAVVLLLPVAVLAADAAVGNDPRWWHTLLIDLLLAGGAFLIGMVGRLLSWAFDWFAEKSGLMFLTRVDDLILDVVNDIYQAQIQPMKAAKADGVITADELRDFRGVAIARVKTYLGARGVSKLIGLIRGGADEVIGAKVERAIKTSKAIGAAGSTLTAAVGGPPSDPTER